ncbi:MAG: RNA methyltransferase [Desulfobacterales bacterium]|nr:RNA methyltransferase [Desulfobacterales bacterium]
MNLRKLRRKFHEERKQAKRRFYREKRLNLLAEPGEYEYIIVLDHLKPGYNIGKIFRSADALGAREVHLVGVDFFNTLPAKGSFKCVPAKFYDAFEACHRDLVDRGYDVFAMEPSGGESLHSAELPGRSAFIFGHEEFGLSFDKAAYDGVKTLSIPNSGRVRSLNVSVAASIVMYEYVRRRQLNRCTV